MISNQHSETFVLSVFSSLFSKTLTPAWTYSCQATLWRILLSDRGRILGECRDQELKKTRFFCVDEQTGEVLWHHTRPEEQWWIGLEAVHAGRVFLHGFESPDMPEHKRIIALDMETGEEAWKNDEMAFWFAYGSKLYAYRTMFEKKTGFILDSESGEVLERIENVDDLAPVRQLARAEDVHARIDFPELVDRDSLPPDVLDIIDRETKGRDIVGGVEVVVNDRYVVMNYHKAGKQSTPHIGLLEVRILVFDRKDGKRVFSDILLRDARAPVPDAFFIKDFSMFFIKDQKTLCMIPLEHVRDALLP